jgi:hypothetical protein
MAKKQRPTVGDPISGFPEQTTTKADQQMDGKSSSFYDFASRHVNRYSNSWNRLGHILEFNGWLGRNEWLTLLGENWESSDMVFKYASRLRRILKTAGPLPAMMTPAENAFYNSLPDRITIYRGCQQANLMGLCWTLDRALANSFTQLSRFEVEEPLLATATVPKKKVLAVKLGRNETEIITLSPKLVTIEAACHDPVWLAECKKRVEEQWAGMSKAGAA